MRLNINFDLRPFKIRVKPSPMLRAFLKSSCVFKTPLLSKEGCPGGTRGGMPAEALAKEGVVSVPSSTFEKRSKLPYACLLLLCLLRPGGPVHASDGEPAPRLVTIGGAATEIVWALGAGEAVVAVDSSSTYPAEARERPKVGYVRNISPEGVLSVEPDRIVATGALGPPNARRALERVGVETVWLPDPKSVEDLRESVRAVGRALNREAEAGDLLAAIDEDIANVRTGASEIEEAEVSVLFLLEPPGPSAGGMAGGLDSRADALIRLAGGRNAADSFTGFQPVSRESLLAMNPDVILVGQSDGHGGSAESIAAMRESSVLKSVSAIRRGAVHAVPLDDLAFGPRLGGAAARWHAAIAEAAETKL